MAGDRIPVIASGHISDSMEDQIDELRSIADTGVDAVVLVSNRLAAYVSGSSYFTFSNSTSWILMVSFMLLKDQKSYLPYSSLQNYLFKNFL